MLSTVKYDGVENEKDVEVKLVQTLRSQIPKLLMRALSRKTSIVIAGNAGMFAFAFASDLRLRATTTTFSTESQTAVTRCECLPNASKPLQ